MRDASTVTERFVLYAVDLAGNRWDVATGLDGPEAWERLKSERAAHKDLVHGIYSEEYPEAGDMELRLEEDIANAEYDIWREERRRAGLCIRWYAQDGPVCVEPYDHLGRCVSADGTSTLSMAAGILGRDVPALEEACETRRKALA